MVAMGTCLFLGVIRVTMRVSSEEIIAYDVLKYKILYIYWYISIIKLKSRGDAGELSHFFYFWICFLINPCSQQVSVTKLKYNYKPVL